MAPLCLIAAPTPQDQFLYIYFLLQESDNLDKSGQKASAYTRYQEVLRRLENLKKNNPDWEPVIVNFRIRYVKEKIAALAENPDVKGKIDITPEKEIPDPKKPAPVAVQLPPSPPPVSKPLEKPTVPEIVVQKPSDSAASVAGDTASLKQRITQLEIELNNTKNRLLTVIEERDSYRSRLESAEKELTALKSGGAGDERVTKLMQENSSLREQLSQAEAQINALRTTGESGNMANLQSQLKKVQDQLALLERENTAYKQTTDALKSQLEDAQKKLNDSAQSIASSKAPEEARKEIEILRNIINRQLQEQARRDTAKRLAMEELQSLRIKSESLRQQIELLGSPLTVLSAEELALLRSPDQVDVLTPDSSFKAPLENTNPPTTTTTTTSPPPSSSPSSGQAIPSTPAPSGNSELKNRARVPEDMRQAAQDASELFNRKQYDQAAEIYKGITDRYPDSLYAWSNLGVVRFQQGSYEDAERALRQAIRLSPNDAFSHSVLGIVYYQLGKYDDAVTLLTKATTLDPNDAKTRNYLGIACSQKGWQEAAEQECRKAIELDPNYGDAHFNLAVIYATQKPPSKELARKHYKEAINLGIPKDPKIEEILNK